MPNASKSKGDTPLESGELVLDAAQHQHDQHQDKNDAGTASSAVPSAEGHNSHGIQGQTQVAPAVPSVPTTSDGAVHPSLPAFIIPLPDTLDHADLIYLRSKEALSLPSDEFRDVCVARYLEFTHPLLPLLNKRQLISITLTPDEASAPEQLSLLLFHAVMCSAVTFVEDHWITREGFSSKQAARRAFFNWAKVSSHFMLQFVLFKTTKRPIQVLFNCNAEPDRFVACQAAVLLSTWYPGKREKADSWYWTGTAVSLAYSIQLHLEPDERFDITEQRLRRRLWWSVFARDQKVSLALGRPHRSIYYSVGMLTADDFDEAVHAPMELPSETTKCLSILRDQKTHDILARLCIEHMKLCVCIALFVSTIFKCRQQMQTRTRMNQQGHLLPSPSARLNHCTQDFARWYRDIAPDLRYEANATTSSQDGNEHVRTLTVHKSTVHVLYHVAISALYRVKALSPSSSWRDSLGEPHGASQRILRHTAWELTRINQDLYQSGLLPYCSTGAVGSVVAAVVIHLLDVKAPNGTVRRAAVSGIQQCKRFLLILKDSYGTAFDALEYLREAEKQDADLAVAESQDTVNIGNIASRSSTQTDPLPQNPWLSTMLQDVPSAAAETPAIPALESSPFKEADEIFWQSWLEGASNYDFLDGSNLPLYDLGFSSTGVGSFDMPNVFPEPG